MASMPIGEAELSLEAPRGVASLVRPMLGRLADLLLPPVCISSTRIGSHGVLCGACFARID
jgi:hypothetical protein